jgi:transcriptional regulator with XRE-family HTH domain
MTHGSPRAKGKKSDEKGPSEFDLAAGRNLRRLRHRRGLTQEQLAAACGVRFQQIQKYECAANRMSFERALQLAEALECHIWEICPTGASNPHDFVHVPPSQRPANDVAELEQRRA